MAFIDNDSTGDNYATIYTQTFNLCFFIMLTHNALAETIEYSIRADGLACPYCAYGIEKKLNQLNGVKFKDMDLENGIVTVEAYNVRLSDEQLRQLFEDAGFTYRSKQEKIRE